MSKKITIKDACGRSPISKMVSRSYNYSTRISYWQSFRVIRKKKGE